MRVPVHILRILPNLIVMSLTLARSERAQNVLTHASLEEKKFTFFGETVSNVQSLYLLVYF